MVQMRCWKNWDEIVLVAEWQFPHILARVSVRAKGGDMSRCAYGVRAAGVTGEALCAQL